MYVYALMPCTLRDHLPRASSASSLYYEDNISLCLCAYAAHQREDLEAHPQPHHCIMKTTLVYVVVLMLRTSKIIYQEHPQPHHCIMKTTLDYV